MSIYTATNSGTERTLISTVTEHHDYIYASGLLLRETITTTAADGTVTVEVLDFAYDNAGTPYALTHTNGTTSTTYYYITNLQGDVIYLVDANGNTAAEYAYDAYGKITAASGSMAEINPLRYRGYYYDKESCFYYLQSRYYDPIVKRFLNADALASTAQGFIGHNMFAYCNNNPVNYADFSGSVPTVADLLISAISSFVVTLSTGGSFWEALWAAGEAIAMCFIESNIWSLIVDTCWTMFISALNGDELETILLKGLVCLSTSLVSSDTMELLIGEDQVDELCGDIVDAVFGTGASFVGEGANILIDSNQPKPEREWVPCPQIYFGSGGKRIQNTVNCMN